MIAAIVALSVVCAALMAGLVFLFRYYEGQRREWHTERAGLQSAMLTQAGDTMAARETREAEARAKIAERTAAMMENVGADGVFRSQDPQGQLGRQLPHGV